MKKCFIKYCINIK